MGRYVPRTASILPPSEPPSFTITKTLRFVSGFLGSQEASSPKAKGKGKERVPSLSVGDQGSPVDILQFGKELPRALDVVGEKIGPVLLNGECKIVVIGIAGWSPGRSLFRSSRSCRF
jgi:hypothetical protein